MSAYWDNSSSEVTSSEGHHGQRQKKSISTKRSIGRTRKIKSPKMKKKIKVDRDVAHQDAVSKTYPRRAILHHENVAAASGKNGSIFLTSSASHTSLTTPTPFSIASELTSLMVAPTIASESSEPVPTFSLMVDSSTLVLPTNTVQTVMKSSSTTQHGSSTTTASNSSPNSIMAQPNNQSAHTRMIVGAIVGSIVGLVLMIMLLGLGCLCLRRRRDQRRSNHETKSSVSSSNFSTPRVTTYRTNSGGSPRFQNTQRRISMLSPLRTAPRLNRTDSRRPLTASTSQTGPSSSTPMTNSTTNPRRHPLMHPFETHSTNTPTIPPHVFIPPPNSSLHQPPLPPLPSPEPRLTPLQQYQTGSNWRPHEETSTPTISLITPATTTPVKRKPIASTSFSQPRLPSRTNTTVTSSSNNSQTSQSHPFGRLPPVPPTLRLLPPSTDNFSHPQRLFPSISSGPTLLTTTTGTTTTGASTATTPTPRQGTSISTTHPRQNSTTTTTTTTSSTTLPTTTPLPRHPTNPFLNPFLHPGAIPPPLNLRPNPHTHPFTIPPNLPPPPPTPPSSYPPQTALSTSTRYTPSAYSSVAPRYSQAPSSAVYSRLSTATTFTSSHVSLDSRTGERRRSDPFDFDR